jgi:hypothetical protein
VSDANLNRVIASNFEPRSTQRARCSKSLFVSSVVFVAGIEHPVGDQDLCFLRCLLSERHGAVGGGS